MTTLARSLGSFPLASRLRFSSGSGSSIVSARREQHIYGSRAWQQGTHNATLQSMFILALPTVLARRHSTRRRTLVSVAGETDAKVQLEVDPQYPGTAVERLRNIHARVKSLVAADLNGDWEEVRRKLLWAGGLKDLPDATPGQGYTGHAFNDDNHCDLCAMLGDVSDNLNSADMKIKGIAIGNNLGPGIKIASLPELGTGGSWSTCTNGANMNPPSDVAHIQFRSRIAFKLVWVPTDYTTFVLVDDEGDLLARGTPTGRLPAEQSRIMNFMLVANSKYARAADAVQQAQMA